MTLKSPFPYFGGKRLVAKRIWDAIGDVPNYVEPFLGSASILLARPAEHERKTETVNDKDGMVSNFWRAVQADAQKVAEYADWPVNENDLHARHAWLVGQRENMTARLEGDPDWYDAKIAGWWVWGMACWIGGEFCSGQGPWQSINGELVNTGINSNSNGIKRQRASLGDDGRGVTRKRVHFGGVSSGQGVQRKLGKNGLQSWFGELQERLKRVRVCSGDWKRVTGRSVTTIHGLTGMVLDPPYVMDKRDKLYTYDSDTIASEVREWAIENGNDTLMRIVYCGYEDGYRWPDDWQVIEWKTSGGYQSHNKENRALERLWLSPHCIGGK